MAITRVSTLYGSKDTIYENLIKNALVKTRCCIPGIIQSYNSSNNTAEVKPAIRESIIGEDGDIHYVELPLLINVPVVFPQSSVCSIKFPLNKNDECLVLFSDLSIDNFWLKGSVQNPVEVRRHDLSDGIAIPCSLSIPKTQSGPSNSIDIKYENSNLSIGPNDFKFTGSYGSFTGSEVYGAIHSGG